MFWYRSLTHTEAVKSLKREMRNIPAPKPTREGYDQPDGRQVIPRLSLVQQKADLILRRKA